MNLPRDYSNAHCKSSSEIIILSSLSSGSFTESCSKMRDSIFFLSPPLSSLCPQHTRYSVRLSAGIWQHLQSGKRVAFFTGALFTRQVGRHGHCRQKRGKAVLRDGVSFVLSMVTVAAVMSLCSFHGILLAERDLIDGKTQHKGRRPLVRSSPRGISSCRRTRTFRIRHSASFSCWSPRKAFLTPFSASPLHLPPVHLQPPRSIALKRASLSLLAALI